MIEYFLIKLADGRELKVNGKILAQKLPDATAEELAKILKNDTMENLLINMSEQLDKMKSDSTAEEHIALQDKHIASQDQKILEQEQTINNQDKQIRKNNQG